MAKEYIVIKAHFKTPRQDNGFFMLAIETQEKKTYESLAIYGNVPDMGRINVHMSLNEFRDAALRMRFNKMISPRETSDLERYIANSSRNMEFIDNILTLAKKNRIEDMQYKFKTDIEVAMRLKELEVELTLESKASIRSDGNAAGEAAGEAPAGPDISGHTILAFCLDPLKGAYLSELTPGSEVIVKLAKAKKQAIDLTNDPVDEEQPQKPEEIIAVFRSMENNPSGGKYVFVDLPSGSGGVVIEEEPMIRVKRPMRKAQAAGRPAREAPVDNQELPIGELIKKPAFVLAAIAVIAVILILIGSLT